MKFLALCLLSVAVGGKADGGLGLDGLVYAPGHASADYYAYPAYAFEYSVKDPHTGDNKAQWEKRDGDVVKGAYSLVEPDGSVRVVEYYADDKTGFNAVVKRLGPNLHPVGPAPIYKAPIPVLGHGHYAPISVGPVAELKGLSAAPLISGPIHGGAISSATLYKAPFVKTIAPAPIISAPIVPVIKEPLLQAPHGSLLGLERGPYEYRGPYELEKGLIGLKEGSYLGPLIKEGPILPGPIIKSGPILGPLPWGAGDGSGYGPGPLFAPASLIKSPLIGEPWLNHGSPIYKSGPLVDLPLGAWDKGQIGPIGDIGGELGDGYLNKGPLLSGWGWGGLKH